VNHAFAVSRDYGTSKRERATGMDKGRREALLEEYRQVAQNFRLLTDIRFKLLAFLPIAAATAAALRGEASGDASEAATTLAICIRSRRDDRARDV
jgi:hypothetical protein